MDMTRQTLAIYLSFAILGASVFGSVPVIYVENAPNDDMIMAFNISLMILNPIWNADAKSLCVCKMMCFARLDCLTFYYDGNEGKCTLSHQGPQQHFRQSDPAGFVGYYTKAVPHYDYRKGSDGYTYVVPNFSLNFYDARGSCQGIPGHRLALVKTMSQYRAVKEISADLGNAYLWVDMMEIFGGAQWADGTEFSDTELFPTVNLRTDNEGITPMIFTQYGFNDDLPSVSHRFICQALPPGRDW